jgi:O-methyltransferase involved in polyketide biosynthesis
VGILLTLRQCIAEDWIAAVKAHQVVLLGAGLDTLAHRPHPAELRVVEVDLPATQTYKRQLLRERGV